MRSLVAAMLMLSASVAFVDTAPAQTYPKNPPGYSSVQAQAGLRRPAQDNLRPTPDDLEKIDRDNRDLDLPPSGNGIAGAGPIPGGRGGPEKIPPAQGPWSPIYNGFDHQPTEREMKALNENDVSDVQAREIDRLYDELMSSGKPVPRRHPARRH